MNLPGKVQGRWRRTASRVFATRPVVMRNQRPIISFTFDDFPRSAVHVAGEMLVKRGLAGTYYASFGLRGTTAPTGEIFIDEDVPVLLAQGHEIGCHTFEHHHAYDPRPDEFEASILRNREAAAALDAGIEMITMSYPISGPRPATKRRCARHFAGCRAGGQIHNSGRVDLNSLCSFFLEQSLDRPAAVRAAIDANRDACGWLVFSTHDVCEDPTPYGCPPGFFEEALDYAAGSGALLLPVSQALREIGAETALPRGA